MPRPEFALLVGGVEPGAERLVDLRLRALLSPQPQLGRPLECSSVALQHCQGFES